MIPGSASQFFLGASQATGGAAGGYQISRSLRFSSGDSSYLSRTPGSTSNRTTFTWSGWVKRSNLSGGTGPGDHLELFGAYSGVSDDTGYFNVIFQTGTNKINVGFLNFGNSTTPVYRDLSAWYHVVVAVDTNQATLNNRIKVYINGVDQNLTVDAGVTLGLLTAVNYAGLHTIGAYKAGAQEFYYFSGYLADIYFIDGQQLTPSSFGETDATTGVWNPKAYTGSYGTNGYHLDFADNSNNTASTLGKDTSGNSPANNWTPNNLSVTAGAGNDSLVDVPTTSGTDNGNGGEIRGNYATLNPLWVGSQITLSNGNLDFSHVGNGTSCRVLSTIAMSSGKWYCEYTCTSTSTLPMVGIALAADSPASGFMGASAGSYGYYASNGNKYANGSLSSAYGATWGTSGDVIGIAFDADNGTLTFYKNGVSQGTAFTGISAGSYVFGQGDYTGTAYTGSFNFGQRSWAYAAPSGFKALCTANLPAPLVTKPNTVMDVKLYTGNGSTQTISGLGFSPDLVWSKARSYGYGHAWFDSVRGVNKYIASETTAAESNLSPNGLTAFNSDGWTESAVGGYNNNGTTYVAWAWDGGSSTVSNTQGSITSTVRANATAGFSIVSYTGTGTSPVSVGHGLGVAPTFLIFKDRDTVVNWQVWTTAISSSGTVLEGLNTTAAGTTPWTYISTTSSLIQFNSGNSSQTTNGKKFICYAFSPVVGYSNGFSYTGNGSADGVFVYLGMRPKLLLIKRTDSTGNWYLWDTVRNTYNVVGEELYPNLSNAASTATDLDILSNGFKMRSTTADFNASGGTYVGFAWAESPFNYSRAR